MDPIEFLRKTNTVLIFILLIAAILFAGFLMARLHNPITTVNVNIDSMHVQYKPEDVKVTKKD